MHTFRLLRLASMFCFLSLRAAAQQIGTPIPNPPPLPQPNAQAAPLIQQSLAALTGGSPVTDVTMSGTYTITDASGTRNGTITMTATASGQGQLTITLPSGTYSEVRSISGGSAIMSETGSDGVQHTITTQTALSPNPAWFCPTLVLASASSPNYLSSYLGQETMNGSAVQHLALWWLPGTGSSAAASNVARFWQQATQHEIYLDASSLLPVAMNYSLQPYNPNNPNQPIIPYRGSSAVRVTQVQFSNYQLVQGRPVAFHIHSSMPVSLFDTLTSDIQLSSVTFNTGTTITMPTEAN